jgi:hypothetical protein
VPRFAAPARPATADPSANAPTATSA